MSDIHEPAPDADGREVMSAEEPDIQADDLHIEVSDLRHEPLSDTEKVPWHRQRMQVPRPLAAAVLAVLLVLLVLVGTPIGSALLALVPHAVPTPTSVTVIDITITTATITTPTPSPFPTPTLIAPVVGPVPANCPPSTRLVAFAPDTVIPGVGGSGVWLIGFFGPGNNSMMGQPATARMGGLLPSDYTRVGWPVQVQLLIKIDMTQTITIRGKDLRTGYNLWLSADANNPGAIDEATPFATIDANEYSSLSRTSDAQWKIWFGVLYLPGAGCYTLQANWPGGNGWTVNFAAGR